ncbi:hypothetical protein Vadar_023620 [Vaccinium darrowii]|uniref:Uncharacterized protein n=1 Tax=Vaccinium darrowii TaxID=229202 RepID=A0ACB7YYM9_9ERIC|nr:hypothetical protein Vadar_023620 [Vaccinium darrowii]
MANITGRWQASDRVIEEFEPSAAWTEDSSSHYLLVDVPGFQKEWLKLQVHDLHEHGYIKVGGEKPTENKVVYFDQKFKIPENSDTTKITGRYEGGVLYVIVPKLVKDEEREPRDTTSTEEKHKHEHDQEEHNKKHEHKHDLVEHKEKHEHKHDLEEHHEKHEHKHDLEEHKEKHEHHQEEHDRGGHIGHRVRNDHKKKVVEEGGFHDATAETLRVEGGGGLSGSLMQILSKNKGIVVTAVLAFSLGVLLSQKFQSCVGT